ncbi:T9SS type A sorting domain-containing protein [Marivirga salinae]|uniref:T9SS type A sorting domain-containing protein n=1 Tax=Marivirga salinarum TaxID=3059078 RepID=A0AA51RBG5_9BACT|nr:T9SS type A sorting domain-containing protein [Marivirga sp. BDSF4-3]WMN12196.1 T9SS type A sorting domain-containing protein [Marivirga sp. BDSF4-3]
MKKFLLILFTVLFICTTEKLSAQEVSSVNLIDPTDTLDVSITLNAEINTDASADVNYSFDYGTTAGGPYNTTVSGSETAVNISREVSEGLTSLTPGEQYFYKFTASTTSPASTQSTAESTFWTLSTQPSSHVNNLELGVNRFTDSIYLTFDSYTFPDNGGFLLYYKEGTTPQDLTDLKNGDRPETQIAGANLVFEPDDTKTVIGTAGLSPGVEYTFILPIYNTNGNDDETFHFLKSGAPVRTYWTLSAPPAGITTLGTENNIAANSVDLDWNDVTDATGYVVIYTQDQNAITTELDNVIDGTTPDNLNFSGNVGSKFVTNSQATLTGLQADRTYYYYVIPYAEAADPSTINYFTQTAPEEGTFLTSCITPTETVSNLQIGTVTSNSIQLTWDDPDSLNVLVVARITGEIAATLVDDQIYNANSNYSSEQIGTTGNYVVYNNTGTGVNVTNLSDYEDYTFDVYLYNDNGECYSSKEIITQQTSCDPATTSVGGEQAINISSNQLDVEWTKSSGAVDVLVVARLELTAAEVPSLNTNYDVNSSFEDGGGTAQTGTGNYVVYSGSGSSVTVTNLDALTDYAFDIYEYNPNGFCYNTNGETVLATTDCAPPDAQSSFNPINAADINPLTIEVSWTSVSGADKYLVVVREESPVNFEPVIGTPYETGVDSDYTEAVQVQGGGNNAVYNGTGNSVMVSGLNINTSYYFAVFAYNSSGNCYVTPASPGTTTATTDGVASNNTLNFNGGAATISSVDNDNTGGNFITVLDFDAVEGGNEVGNDGVDTKLEYFTFSRAAGDYFGGLNIAWSDVIAEARLVNVTNNITQTNDVTVNNDNITVDIPSNQNDDNTEIGFLEEGTTVRFQLQVRLNEVISAAEIDNKNLVFELAPADVLVEDNSSTFDAASTTISSGNGNNKIVVQATQFEFTTDPPDPVNAGVDVTPQAVVQAKDINGNLDLNYGNFTISNADNIPMNNLPATPSFTNGEFEFPANFNYQGSGDGTLTITDGSNLFDVSSISVTVNPTIDLTELTAGLNNGTLESSTTDQAVLGFAIDVLGSTQFNSIEFSTNIDLTNKVSNIQLVGSNDNTYDGTDGVIASSPTVDNVANTISFTGLSESLTSGTYNYFLVLDVENSVNEFDTPDLTLGLDISDIGLSNSPNKNAANFSQTYGFKDVTKPEVSQITATPVVLSDSDDGTDALEIKVTFNEIMDNSIIPIISFPNPAENPTNSLTGPNGNSGWSLDNTFYTFYFDLTDANELIENIDVLIKNAEDKSGNVLSDYTETDLFTIDTENPTAIDISFNIAEVSRLDDQLVLTATYNEAMDQNSIVNFNVNGTANLDLVSSGWNSATEYEATFTHDLTEEETQNVIIEVAGGTDIVGNIAVTEQSGDFSIDTQKPRLLEIVSTSDNKLYGPGDEINIQLVFDEDVDVSGTPLLDLNSGGQAQFQSVAGNIVNFKYTVEGVNSGENTLGLDVDAFDMNSGTIRDLANNDAEIVLPVDPKRLQDNAAIQVDTNPADIVNVTATPDQGFFSTGEQIEITIEFNEDVEVTGTPLLALNSGSNAEYASGSNSTILTFNYTVEASDGGAIVDVSDLNYADINSLNLNGGTIVDAVGIAANLDLPATASASSLSGNTSITIDTEDPELANNPFNPTNGEFNVSQSLNFTIEMNEPVSGQETANISIIDKQTTTVISVLDAGTAFTNNTSNTLEFDSFENLLEDSTEYYIVFDPGALVDRAGNEFAGFTADNIWSFTTFGPARIDDFSIGACVGEVFTIQGQYFTGVSRIRTNINGTTPFTISTFTIIDDENIEFTVPAGTEPGTITLDKQNGQAGNTEDASTTSVDPIKVGPSSAQLTLVNPSNSEICDIDDLGNENEVEFTVDIVGGSGVYTLVYQVNSETPITITAYEENQTFSVVPPNPASNNVTILSLTDEDDDLNTCSAPDLGADVEILKFIRSRVDAGGFESQENDYGIIELCGANTSIVDFSDQTLVTTSPSITGDVQQGTWTIDDGPSSNGGGFSPDFSLKSVQTDRPDTVKYYASFADGIKGEITLELTSDDPGGLNPCVGTNDFVILRFVESISVNTDKNVSVCLEEDENGVQYAVTTLNSAVSGGSASDILGIEWTRVDEFNEAVNHDGSWGFKDDENQATYSLTSNALNPIYKASPQEVQEGRSTVEALPVLLSGVGCGPLSDPREVNIRINDKPDPTKSTGPEIVCASEQEVRFRMNPSSPGNTFEWKFTGEENEFDGSVNSNLVFVNFRSVESETTDTLVVQEFNPNTGCISKPDTFFITLKPLPIANIKYNSTTTISNSAELISLKGEGGVEGNLVEATADNGQFTGRGVIQNSNGDYFLDSSQLGVTDITDEEDIHEVFFTFTNEFGCSSTDTIAFNVFDAERIFPALAEQYCQLDEADTISVDNAIVPDGFIVSAIDGPGITELGYTDVIVGTDTISVLRVIFDPATAYENNPDTENPSLISITYSIEDPNNAANNVANVGEQIVTVNPLPVLEIDDIEANLCSYDENLEFEPIGNNGDNYSFNLLNEELSDTLMLGNSIEGFEMNLKPLDQYLTDNNQDSIEIFVEYTLTNQNSCVNSRIYNFVVWRQPSQPVLESQDLCVVDGVIDTARVEYNGGKPDEELIWLTSDDFTTDPDAVIATGDTFVPDADFFAAGNTRIFYVFRLNVDSKGEEDPSCVSLPTKVTYRRIDNPGFEWNKSTFGDEDIIFKGLPNQTNLATAEWTITKIGDEIEVDKNAITQLNDSTVAVDFNSYGAGRYSVNFNVSTVNSCSADVTKEIIILPEADLANEYNFEFENSTEGWVSSGFKRNGADADKRLWDFAIPTGASTFESNKPVWITNAEGSYESDIVSYVYSPSMDISNIERPVVSFDLWINMAEDEDGLILEYSTDGKTIEDPEKTWQVLGNISDNVSSGLEWYNATAIEALPGTNNNNPFGFGWSFESNAESIESVNAKHTLEEIEDRDSLIFRFQFKSTSSENNFGNGDGAAFDNFKIESLNRNVLIEYFGDYTRSEDAIEMEAINTEFTEKGNFAWINYRVNENDPLYQQQSSSMLSRVYYYDAYEFADQFAIDGEIRNEFTEVGANDLSRARLFSSSISRIELDVSLVNENELGIDVNFQSNEELGENVNLYVAILQKEISDGAQGTDPTVTYYNVLRKLLPGNSGIEVSGSSGQQTVNFKASRPSDENALAIVAFLQNTETGQILQSAYLDGFPELTFSNVTAIEKELSDLDIRLYPNPAHDNLNIRWDIPLQQEAKAKVIDITGKIIKEFRLRRGESFYELNTSTLKTGMYNLILTNQKGEHKMMKFAVTN